jgi:hypothetical protein
MKYWGGKRLVDGCKGRVEWRKGGAYDEYYFKGKPAAVGYEPAPFYVA